MTTFSFYNVNTTLLDAVTASDTSFTLNGISGLPTAIPSGTVVALGINSAQTGGSYELVYVTAISGDVLTVERGQENTAAVAHSAGDYVNSVPSAGQNANFAQLPQVLNVAPVNIQGTSGTVSGTTYTISASFTVPATGYVIFYCEFNNNSSTGPSGSTKLDLYINGVLEATDQPTCPSWFLSGAASVTPGIVTAEATVLPSTTLASAYNVRGTALFVPSP